jgi:hypothetical protein
MTVSSNYRNSWLIYRIKIVWKITLRKSKPNTKGYNYRNWQLGRLNYKNYTKDKNRQGNNEGYSC